MPSVHPLSSAWRYDVLRFVADKLQASRFLNLFLALLVFIVLFSVGTWGCVLVWRIVLTPRKRGSGPLIKANTEKLTHAASIVGMAVIMAPLVWRLYSFRFPLEIRRRRG